MKKTEHEHQEQDARLVLWQDIHDGKAHVQTDGQLEKELELEFGAFTHNPEDGDPSLVPGVTLGELRRRSEERTTGGDKCAYCESRDLRVPASRIAHCNACGKNFILPSLPLARNKRPLPRLVTRARAADLFERFFGPRTYPGGRIYS